MGISRIRFLFVPDHGALVVDVGLTSGFDFKCWRNGTHTRELG